MAKGRTVSANQLTEIDHKALAICHDLSQLFLQIVENEVERAQLKKNYAKLSLSTRDAGAGLGGGKWQRDAITTRGITNKAPFSNRNLRWHPLVAASTKPEWAKSIEGIDITGSTNSRTLVFRVKSRGKNLRYPSEEVYQLPERFVVLPDHWEPHIEELKRWTDVDWTRNSCIIKAEEACTWQDSVETYAILGMTILNSEYQSSLLELSIQVTELLSSLEVTESLNIVTSRFPHDFSSLENCPVCLNPLRDDFARFRVGERSNTWNPNWTPDKRGEGNDASLQIMHIDPLIESEMRHNASNVRYGHRWCNIAMSDHDLAGTLKFMKEIVNHHEERIQ